MISKIVKVIALTFVLNLAFAKGQIAFTIDDLPFLGYSGKHTQKLRREANRFREVLNILTTERVPAAGFVVAGTIESGQWKLLEEWYKTQNIIANHTYSHLKLSSSQTEQYINDIAKADKILTPLMRNQKYFRYPYLSTGRNLQQKKRVRDYLAKQKYTIAPVTIDSKDFIFNARLMNIPWRKRQAHVMKICQKYLNYVWEKTLQADNKAIKKTGRPIKHILLLHMNLLNVHCLPKLIQLYRKNGYQFITLTKALEDSYYHKKKKTIAKKNY